MAITRIMAGAVALLNAFAAAGAPQAQPRSDMTAHFEWRSSAPLIAPPAKGETYSGLKDPSVVYSNGAHHVFMTTAAPDGWHLAYARFKDWSEAPRATIVSLKPSGIGPQSHQSPVSETRRRRTLARTRNPESAPDRRTASKLHATFEPPASI